MLVDEGGDGWRRAGYRGSSRLGGGGVRTCTMCCGSRAISFGSALCWSCHHRTTVRRSGSPEEGERHRDTGRWRRIMSLNGRRSWKGAVGAPHTSHSGGCPYSSIRGLYTALLHTRLGTLDYPPLVLEPTAARAQVAKRKVNKLQVSRSANGQGRVRGACAKSTRTLCKFM